eukprot:gene32389-37305_t
MHDGKGSPCRYPARGARFAERAPDFIVDEVLARVQPLFE